MKPIRYPRLTNLRVVALLEYLGDPNPTDAKKLGFVREQLANHLRAAFSSNTKKRKNAK